MGERRKMTRKFQEIERLEVFRIRKKKGDQMFRRQTNFLEENLGRKKKDGQRISGDRKLEVFKIREKKGDQMFESQTIF